MVVSLTSLNSRRQSSRMGLEVVGILCGGVGVAVVAGVVAIVVFGRLGRR
jgi:hypothetical protein